MITESSIYWITRLDCINTFLVIMMILGIVFGISIIISVVESSGHWWRDDELYSSVKIAVGVLMCSFICAVALIFVPTTKEMCAIKVIPAIANNENVRQIGGDVMDLAKDWLNELKPNNGK